MTETEKPGKRQTGRKNTAAPSGKLAKPAAKARRASAPAGAVPPQPGPQQVPQPKGTQISCSRGLHGFMERTRLSFGFTSYQSGRLYLVGRMPRGRVSFHERHFMHAMGVAAAPQRLYLGTQYQVWRLENVLAPGQTLDGFDRNYVPRNAQTTGDVDVHELGVDRNGRVIFVNTKFSCLASFSLTHSFRPLWQPPFISRLAPEDRCHLNGLAMEDGEARFVTAVCRSDVVTGWRDRRASGGLVMDVQSDRIVTEDMSMPHSPRLHEGELYVLDSGRGTLCRVDRQTGKREAIAFLPGFARGLGFHGPYAFVGLSLPRDGSFSGLELDGELERRDADPWCGVQIIDTRNGDVVEWIRLRGEVRELFDVFVLPGVTCPKATGLLDGAIRNEISIELPPKSVTQSQDLPQVTEAVA